jgi:hypothetical protein
MIDSQDLDPHTERFSPCHAAFEYVAGFRVRKSCANHQAETEHYVFYKDCGTGHDREEENELAFI